MPAEQVARIAAQLGMIRILSPDLGELLDCLHADLQDEVGDNEHGPKHHRCPCGWSYYPHEEHNCSVTALRRVLCLERD